MFQLGKTIVSEDILSNDFVCNLTACKGACCVVAMRTPLSLEETTIFKKIYQRSNHSYANEIAVIEAQGTSVVGTDGDLDATN
jgi:hypothetical protein